MASVSNVQQFDMDDEQEFSIIPDSTCPDCGTDSIATYLDRYSSYEYCTNCDWSDEESPETASREQIGRRDRVRSED